MCLRFLIQSPAQLMGFLVKTTSEFEEIHSHNHFFFCTRQGGWHPGNLQTGEWTPVAYARKEPAMDQTLGREVRTGYLTIGLYLQSHSHKHWKRSTKRKKAKQNEKRKKGPLFFFIHKHKLIGLYIALKTYLIYLNSCRHISIYLSIYLGCHYSQPNLEYELRGG